MLFRSLQFGEQDAVIKIFQSCVKHPVLFGGSESVNSILTKSSNKKVLVKNGADGVFIAVIPDEKSVLVVKIKDGNMKAAEVAIAGLLEEMKFLNNEETKKIKSQPILNSTLQKIGKLEWIATKD